MSERAWYLAWIRANAFAEALGLGGAALLLLALGPTLEESRLKLMAIGLASLLEGSLVAGLQGRLLRRRLRDFDIRAWWLATLLGTTTAWLLGMLPSLLMDNAFSGRGPVPG